MGSDLVPWRRPSIEPGADLETVLASVPEEHRDQVAELYPQLLEGQEIRWAKAGYPYLFDPAPRPARAGWGPSNGVNEPFTAETAALASERAQMYRKLKEQAIASAYNEVMKPVLADLVALQQGAIADALDPDATAKDKERGLREAQRILDRMVGKPKQVSEVQHSTDDGSAVRRMAQRALERRQAAQGG